MRRSQRWQDKVREQEPPKDHERRWTSHRTSHVDWSMRNESDSHGSVSPTRHHGTAPAASSHHGTAGAHPHHGTTPAPIDYRSESRRRHDNGEGSSAVGTSSEASSRGPQSLMGPPSTHFPTTSWPLLPNPNIFTESGRAAPPAFPTHHHWGQAHPAYFHEGRGQYAFDMKWWTEQKQSLDFYIGGPSWRDDANNRQKSAFPPWSYGTRVVKSYPRRHGSSGSRSGSRHHQQLEGSFDAPRQECNYDDIDPRRRSTSTLHQGQKSREDSQDSGYDAEPRRRPGSISYHNGQRSRDGLYDSRRRHIADIKEQRRMGAAFPPSRDLWAMNDAFGDKGRNSSKGKKTKQKVPLSKFDGANSVKCVGPSKALRSASANAFLMQSRGDWPLFKNKGKEKKGKKTDDESATLAEAAKKKALAAAANKLKRTFLAAKKKNVGSRFSAAEDDEEDDDDDDDEDTTEPTEDNNAQDLTVPRRHPSCLEFDIDIRFSAKEWASVGRGQGGTSNILGTPQASSASRKRPNTRERRLGCEDIDIEEQEDSGTYSDTDIGRCGTQWSTTGSAQASTRRRHVSESSGVIDLRKRPSVSGIASKSGPVRLRSCSMSVVEGGSSGGGGGSMEGSSSSRPPHLKFSLMPKLKRLMLKQLLTMDKKSLQELVEDPRSRKAQHMMSHLMAQHRMALSQRLSQQRFRATDVAGHQQQDLQLLDTLQASHLASLSPDIIQQVREILALEEEYEESGTGDGGAAGGGGGGGTAGSGSSGVDSRYSWEDVVGLPLCDLAEVGDLRDLLHASQDSDTEPDCQIVSPPPRDPASTITIHDSDSEMEDITDNGEKEEGKGQREEEEEEEEDEEDEEEEEEEEEDEEEEEGNLQSDKGSVGSKDESSSGQEEVKTSTASLPVMGPLPVEVPLCVMDSLSDGGSSSGSGSGPSAPDTTTLSLLGASQQGVGGQATATSEGLPVGGPPTAAVALMLPHQPQPPPQPPPPPPPQPEVKVKEERPSPLSECGLCMHHPRTPHTADCVYPYTFAPPSPVPLLTGRPPPPPAPGPLTATPSQPTLSHLTATHPPPPPPPPPAAVPLASPPLYRRSIKQEKLDESYLKYEHVKRPSSEERPKNPAPPDTAQGEPSPLPLPPPPPPQPLHHPPPPPHPRPLIFSPDHDFPDPPRPPPPPPPQFSPRIKLERHTPVQFMCCCMRNECERSSSHSAEMRPPSRRSAMATPQPPSERRATPYSYKLEPPSPCASQARTPHQLTSPRPCNSGSSRITIGIQTDRPALTPDSPSTSSSSSSKRQYIPNLSLARSVTPLVSTKVDQSTSTDDLLGAWELQQQHQQLQQQQQQLQHQQQQQQQQQQHHQQKQQQPQQHQQPRGKGRGKSWWWHRNGRPRNHLGHLTSISNSLNDFEFSEDSDVALQQMVVLSEQEAEFMRHLDSIDQEMHELMREKRRMMEELARLQHLRIGKLQQLARQANGNGGGGNAVGNVTGVMAVPECSGAVAGTSGLSVGAGGLLGVGNMMLAGTGREPPEKIASYEETSLRLCQQNLSSDAGDSDDAVNSPVTTNMEEGSHRYETPKHDECVQSTTDNISVVSSSQEKTPRVRSFSFSQTSSNDSSNESPSVRRQRCTSTCQSPGKTSRPRESWQDKYLGPFSPPHKEVYQEMGSSGNKVQQLLSSNTDSETDNDAKVSENPRRSPSDASKRYHDDQCPTVSRKRSNSLSSSAEGDIESEVPVELDEEEEEKRLSRLRQRLNGDGEGIVDSSERQDEQVEGEGMHVRSSLCLPQLSLDLHKTLGDNSRSGDDGDDSNNPLNECGEGDEEGKKEIGDEVEYCEAPTPTKPHHLEKPAAPSSSRKSSSASSSSSSSSSSSPSSSPDSHKSRNSSGEHCYSLRSRGPPSEIVDDTLGISDMHSEVLMESFPRTTTFKKKERVGEEDHADDERDKDDEEFGHPDELEGLQDKPEDKKRKRKRKNKKHGVNKRKKKRMPEKNGNKSTPVVATPRRRITSCAQTHPRTSSSDSPVTSLLKDNSRPNSCQSDEEMESSTLEQAVVQPPPPHGSAVLDIKVIGDYVITASSDGTARCYDLISGQVLATYVHHTDMVTCLGVIGRPNFSDDAVEFTVVTGSADKTVSVFVGKTGEIQQVRNVGEGVRCLDIAWGQLFLGTEAGSGARWNFKDKGVSEKVQFCGAALTSIKAMLEGGRRVLLVAAKTTPLMIRDAMSGLFLRTLEHAQLTVYTTVTSGGLLYTGGSNQAIVYYDFTSGNSRGHLGCEADVSCLAITRGHLIATCYDGLIRIFCLATGQLVQRVPIDSANKMFICSALYKHMVLVGNKKGEVLCCPLPPLPSSPAPN